MLKTVTPDPMPGICLAYIKGSVPIAIAGQSYHVWTNSHGAVSAVMPDGERPVGVRGEHLARTFADTISARRDPRHRPRQPSLRGRADDWHRGLQLPSLQRRGRPTARPGLRSREPSRPRHRRGFPVGPLHGLRPDPPGPVWSDRPAAGLGEVARREAGSPDRLGMTVVDAHDLVTREAV